MTENKRKVPRSYSDAEENASTLTELGMTDFFTHTHSSSELSCKRITFTNSGPQLSLPPPFQHIGSRQTNKLFPCNLSHRTSPCPRLFPPQDCLFCLAAAARKRH